MGQVALQTSEIAEDLTLLFLQPASRFRLRQGLGVLMNKDNTVRQAGGFIVQLMPLAEEEVIAKLEGKRIKDRFCYQSSGAGTHRKVFLKKY